MELTQLLAQAEQEIQQLRRRNEILKAKVEVMDAFMCVLYAVPGQQVQECVAPDIASQIREKIAEIESNAPVS